MEDINDYGTIFLPTMRRIIAVKEMKNNKEKEFQKIIDDLGGINYLDKIKKSISIKDEKKEIIIAIEN